MAKIALRRGDVCLVDFDPTVGAEIKKTRPAMVIQNNVANRYSPILIVAAISSKCDDELYPTEILIRAGEAGLEQDSIVLLNQIRLIDRQRVVKRIGKVNEMTLKRVDTAIKISLGLIEM